MLTVHNDPSTNLIETIAVNRLEDSDFEKIAPLIEEKIKHHGTIRLYFEMDNFEGWTPHGFWDELKLDIKYANNMERAALVGDKKWESWLTRLSKPFTKAKVRYFDIKDRQEAKEWIRQ